MPGMLLMIKKDPLFNVKGIPKVHWIGVFEKCVNKIKKKYLRLCVHSSLQILK